MKNILFGVIIALLSILLFRSCFKNEKEKQILEESSMLIEKQIQNVGKLVVTEGHFAEVYTYKNSQQIFGDFFTADKKALVVVNANVTIAYNLSNLKYKVDETTKTLTITHIPQPEIKIHPDIEYYNMEQDYLNPFKAEDYNTIKKNINTSLQKKIEASTLKLNAQDRLLSELSKLYVLTNSLGWKLVYNNKNIEEEYFQQTVLKK